MNDFSIRLFLDEAPKIFYVTANDASPENFDKINDIKLNPLLDNLTILGISLIKFERNQYLNLLRETFYKMYQKAEEFNFKSLPKNKISSYKIWRELLKRIYIIGAYALKRKNYFAANIFINQPIEQMDNDDYWRDKLWFRHGLTMLARANELPEKSLCKMAVDFTKKNSYFYELFEQNFDEIAGFCCQFDWLQCLTVISRTNYLYDPYPSFGIFNNHRTTPIISILIREKSIRDIFVKVDKVDDEIFAEIVNGLDQFANKEYLMFNGWHSGRWPKDIEDFLKANLTTDKKKLKY